MLLTRDSILAADDLPRKLVSVPEWGGDVFVRTMTGGERDQFEQMIMEAGGADSSGWRKCFRAKLAVLTLCDENGKSLFSFDDWETLSKKSAAALDRVFAVASRLNGISKTDVQELEKNSAAGQTGNSSSA